MLDSLFLSYFESSFIKSGDVLGDEDFDLCDISTLNLSFALTLDVHEKLWLARGWVVDVLLIDVSGQHGGVACPELDAIVGLLVVEVD